MSSRVDKGKQPLHPCQTQLVSHWSALEKQNQSSTLLGDHGNDHRTNQWHLQKGKDVTSHISGAVKKRTKLTAIDFGILGKKRRRSKSQRESQLAPNVEHVPSPLSLAPPVPEASYIDYSTLHKRVSQCARELVKSQKVNCKSSYAPPKISDLEEGRCENVRIPTAPSYLCSEEENNNHVASIASSKRKSSDTNIMKVLEHEKCCDGSGVLSDNLSMRHNYPPAFREEQYKKMSNFSSTNVFSACAHQANTTGIYTSAENVGGFPGCPVNRNFPVMKTIDTDLRKEEKHMRNSRVPTRAQENVPIKSYCVPQLIGHGMQGIQIQVLSSDSEGKDEVYNVSATEVVSKNKSAATHTMDMNINNKKHVPGVESSSSKKNINADTDLPQLDGAIGTLGEQIQPRKHPIPEIPDMNIPLHAEPGEASVEDNAEPSTSQTRSLDLNQLPDSNSKWLARLNISDPCQHSVGTKSWRLDEAATQKKANQYVSGGTRGESSKSEPVPVSTGKKLIIPNQKTIPLRGVASSSNDNVDGNDDKKWLYTWIKRWQKSPAETPKNRSEPVGNCDPQCSKGSLQDLEKPPFSSIAAMALLGKGWTDLKCHYWDKGSYTVWK
ncbi:hypothetical protein AgCh_001474 [Apium graveolens]